MIIITGSMNPIPSQQCLLSAGDQRRVVGREPTDDRKFTIVSCQYVSLSCVVSVQFITTLTQVGDTTHELSVSLQEKILKTMRGLVVSE